MFRGCCCHVGGRLAKPPRQRALQCRPPGTAGGDDGVFSARTDDFSFMETHLSLGFRWNSSQPVRSCRHWIRRWPQSGNQSQDVSVRCRSPIAAQNNSDCLSNATKALVLHVVGDLWIDTSGKVLYGPSPGSGRKRLPQWSKIANRVPSPKPTSTR